jgi:poly(3-hydroxybutyrate) depolymerase
MRGRSGPHAWAPQERPPAMPTIVFHGDCDTTVDPGNGSAIVEQVLAAAANASGAVQKLVAAGVSAGGRPYTTTTYGRPNEAPLAEHWIVHGAGHAWSGGSPLGSFTDAAGPDASAEMLRFFLARAGANSRVPCA